MANQEHVEIVKQGVEAIAKWRKDHPDENLDLSNAILRKANLSHANLGHANLTSADLMSAELRHADLSHASPTYADLSYANFGDANLSHANLRNADLRQADLSQADLSHANLSRANLSQAKLFSADLRHAHLHEADLSNANLSYADLRATSLQGARFSSAVVDKAKFNGSRCGDVGYRDTTFSAIDLSTAIGLESVQHKGPSSIDVETLYKSKGRIPEVFLRGCGVPENLITYMGSLTGSALEYYTCFISYAEADDAFSQRLYNDLQAKGVRCWRWKEDAKWGRALMGEVDTAIRLYDKLVVILSETSLQSEPVIREIERALQKEQRDDKDVLFPIRLDNAVFSWEHALQADVVRKVIGDFRDWEKHRSYRESLERLVANLQAEPKPAK